MTLMQMKYAIAVADTKSMNEAARSLFITQPSLSASIKELENEIGVELFKRTNRGITVDVGSGVISSSETEDLDWNWTCNKRKSKCFYYEIIAHE